jgi:hypothetical protein
MNLIAAIRLSEMRAVKPFSSCRSRRVPGAPTGAKEGVRGQLCHLCGRRMER